MNWLGLLSFKAARDPELAPHAYLMYLLLWTLVVGLFVLFLFPLLGKTIGFVIIAVFNHVCISIILKNSLSIVLSAYKGFISTIPTQQLTR